MNNIGNLIDNLNKEQKDAVLSTEGPNLIEVVKMLGISKNILFSNQRVGFEEINITQYICWKLTSKI